MNNHIVKSYDEEQRGLLDELIRMGHMSVSQLEAALDVVERRDDKAAEREVAPRTRLPLDEVVLVKE